MTGGHWRLFVELVEEYQGQRSVELDSQTVHTGSQTDTRLCIFSRPYVAEDKDHVASCAFDVQSDITVQDIINLVLTNNRDKYVLSEAGSGSRFWCETVIADLEANGWIAKTSYQIAREYAHRLARANPGFIPLEGPKGTFYQVSARSQQALG